MMSSQLGESRLTRLHHREEVMGTVVTIDLYNELSVPPAEFSPFLKDALSVLHHADKTFSTWKATSPLSQLRRGEITLGEVPIEVKEVLELCAVAKELSNGWFDPWSLPGDVDPTGYVKGWAAQRALDALALSDVTGAMVNAAGDIASFGRPSPDQLFRVGIADPAQPTTLACVIELRGAVATSGTYERGQHLINPFTRRPVTNVASASVTGPDLGLCDALATALVVGGGEVFDLIEQIPHYEALTIGDRGEQRSTSRLAFVNS